MVAASSPAWATLDPSQRADLAVDGIEPRLHARPASVEACGEVLEQAAADGLAVIPRGGGTHLSLGQPPRRADLVLETTGLDRVIEYEPADLTVTVEAGMRFAALQALLAEQGQLLALDPPVAPESTIGGVIATNASGPSRLAYGTARDLVIGTRVANADGRLTRAGGRVVKNVAGYDLNKLHVGGLGTLGVLVELSFKLAPMPPAVGLVVARMPDAAAAGAFLGAVLHSPLAPLALEVLSPSAAELAGLPRMLAVALRVGGYETTVARQRTDLGALATQYGGTRVDTTDETWEAIRTLALLTTPVTGEASEGISVPGFRRWQRDVLVKAAAPIAESMRLLDLLAETLAGFEPVVWAHGGNGVAYAACVPLGESADGLADALRQARGRVAELGSNASLVVERAPATLKAGIDVWGDPGNSVRLMRAIKDQLDPRGLLNPGRYVGGL